MEFSSTRRRRIEDSQLITDILKRNYYIYFKEEYVGNKKITGNKALELIINRKSLTNQCYGCFNNDETEMYPNIDFSINNYSKIINNLISLLNFYNEQEWKCDIELSGLEWCSDELISSQILSILLDTLQPIIKPRKIIINTDGSFVSNTNLCNKYIKYINDFSQKNILLTFNFYINGLYCDDNNNRTEKFYSQFLNFLHNIPNFHIISYIRPNNINNWKENFSWWYTNLKELSFLNITLKEETSDKWTNQLIQDYLDFINYQIQFYQSVLPIESFQKLIIDKLPNYNFHTISIKENNYLTYNNNNNNCNLFKNLTIDLTTLNFVPCAKLNYPDLVWGQYELNADNKIIGHIANNIVFSIYSTHLKQICLPHCESCSQIEHCGGHCLAASYKKCYDLLMPIKEFCHLSVAKINGLIYTYTKLQLLDEQLMLNLGCSEQYINSIRDIAQYLKEVIKDNNVTE